MNILAKILGVLTGVGTDTNLAGIAARVTALVAALAALAPAALYFMGHRDDVLFTITLGDLVFWLPFVGAGWYVNVLLAHRAPPP